MAGWLIRDIALPAGVWTPLTTDGPPDVLTLANAGRGAVWLRLSSRWSPPGSPSGAMRLAPGGVLSRDDLVAFGMVIWAQPLGRASGLIAVEALSLTMPTDSFSAGFGPALN